MCWGTQWERISRPIRAVHQKSGSNWGVVKAANPRISTANRRIVGGSKVNSRRLGGVGEATGWDMTGCRFYGEQPRSLANALQLSSVASVTSTAPSSQRRRSLAKRRQSGRAPHHPVMFQARDNAGQARVSAVNASGHWPGSPSSHPHINSPTPAPRSTGAPRLIRPPSRAAIPWSSSGRPTAPM